MLTILGNEDEEQARKADLKSILSATFWGFCLGGLAGGLVAGYGGFLIGLFVGAFSFSLFSILGVRATRRQLDARRSSSEAEAAPRGGPPPRNSGRPR